MCNCPSRGTRRCTNEAARSARISQWGWPYLAGGAQCVPPHSGQGVLIQRLARVIRDTANLSLPATARLRQTRWASRPALRGHGGGGGSVGSILALVLGCPGSVGERWLPALMRRPPHGNSGWWDSGWWCRLGCTAGSFLPRVHLSIFESGVRGRDPPDEEITETVISREEWYLRVGLSLFGHGRMRSASVGKITKWVISGS